MTTIERKQMSTKTTIKRLALVAAASLGLGVISAVPSQAAPSGVTITVVSNGTKTQGAATADTTTGAFFNVSSLLGAVTDSLLVTVAPKSYPSGNSASSILGAVQFIDTALPSLTVGTTDTVTMVTNAAAAQTGTLLSGQTRVAPTGTGASTTNRVDTLTMGQTSVMSVSQNGTTAGTNAKGVDSITTSTSGGGSANGFVISAGSSGAGYVGARFLAYLDFGGSSAGVGTYTFTVTVVPYTGTTAGTAVTQDVSIVVSAITATAGSTSTAYLGTSSNAAFNTDTITAEATSDNATAAAYLAVNLYTSASTQITSDTVIVTTNIGNVGTTTAIGKNVQFAYTGSAVNIAIFPDGTSGTANICASTNSGLVFPCRTLIFYSTSVSSITVTPLKTTLAVGSNTSAFIAKAVDASGNWVASSSAYRIFSSDRTIVSETATAGCSIDLAGARYLCTLTGVATGSADIIVGSNTAKATPTAAFTVRVTNNAIASIALQTNKTSYAPGEKAYVRVVALDSAGKSVAPQTVANFFGTGGITTDVGLGANSADLTSTSVTLGNQTATGYATGDAVGQFTVYMPSGASSVTFSATGGSGLPAALQGKALTSVTVSVSDSGSQALAAVTALASQVSAFITKINAQITTLTDLVMKIQKKVKA